MYCITCGRIFCERCKECKEHEILPIEKLIDRNNVKNLKNRIKIYAKAAPTLLEVKNGALEKLEKKVENLNEMIEAEENNIKKARKNESEDYELASEIISYIREMKEKAHTKVLQGACKKSIDMFDIEDEIQEEISSYMGELYLMENKIKKYKLKIREITLEKLWLTNLLFSEKQNVVNEKTSLSFALILEKDLFRDVGLELYKTNCSVTEFRSFSGSHEFCRSPEMNDNKLIDLGNGVKISPIVPLENTLKGGSDAIASISHEGIMAVYTGNGGCVVQFSDLSSSDQFSITVENESKVGFYDDKIVLLTTGQVLREVEYEKLMTQKNTSAFRNINSVSVICKADVSKLNATKILYYTSINYDVYKFDFSNMKNISYNFGRKATSIASSSGICNRYDGIFHEFQGNRWSYTSLGGNNSQIFCENTEIAIIIPSVSDPNNTGRMLKVLTNCCFYFQPGTTVGIDKYVVPAPFSIVRVYRDVFVMYDRNKSAWVAARIVVE